MKWLNGITLLFDGVFTIIIKEKGQCLHFTNLQTLPRKRSRSGERVVDFVLFPSKLKKRRVWDFGAKGVLFEVKYQHLAKASLTQHQNGVFFIIRRRRLRRAVGRKVPAKQSLGYRRQRRRRVSAPSHLSRWQHAQSHLIRTFLQ